MNKVGSLGLLAVALAGSLLTAVRLEAEIVQKCINRAAGFSLEFPGGWEISENPKDGVSLIAFRPPEKADESVYERLEVALRRDEGEGPDDFFQEHILCLRKNYPDFALISEGSEKLSGLTSRFLVYAYTDTFFTLKVLAKAKQWMVWRDGRVYLITGTATVASFPQWEEAFQKIAGSFHLLD